MRATSSLRRPAPAVTWYSCHPAIPATMSPASNPGFSDSITSATVAPIITSPSGWGAAYDLASSIRPRMYGSRERYCTRVSTCPSRMAEDVGLDDAEVLLLHRPARAPGEKDLLVLHSLLLLQNVPRPRPASMVCSCPVTFLASSSATMLAATSSGSIVVESGLFSQ